MSKIIHGKHGTKIYSRWLSMKHRCLSPSRPDFYLYGGRGITMCPEWMEFSGFYADMGDPPGPGYSLDRINDELGYCKSNCRWATPFQQRRNTRSNVWISFQGKTMVMRDWAIQTGLPYRTIQGRYRVGKRGADLFTPCTRAKGVKG